MSDPGDVLAIPERLGLTKAEMEDRLPKLQVLCFPFGSLEESQRIGMNWLLASNPRQVLLVINGAYGHRQTAT